jgi:hypothetical protein
MGETEQNREPLACRQVGLALGGITKENHRMNYESLRAANRPRDIRVLMIAESPPASESGRFFYKVGVMTGDALFLDMMKVCFPEMASHQTARQIRSRKAQYLAAFKERGYYLVDATDSPVAGLTKSQKMSALLRDRLQLQAKIRKLVTTKTPIILITRTVWEVHYESLKSLGYNVINSEPISHPAYGNNQKFRQAQSANLRKTGLL